ncbi:hypothetical protein JFU37_16085 [Pseudomonas sp. TH41]|uniref:hypothetical protein n=1 Tax=Pseudomonas sp. TH41 TaxID=2796405 RepID=UPI0019112B25|nr:hypothetical protein [Pseudomonas sp. TH41]MBK5354021.1 hypothetical protein [Pseudomonas sp. TH41]
MDPSVVNVWLTGEVDVGPRQGLGKLGNMSMGAMKKLGSVRWERAVLAGVHGVGATLNQKQKIAAFGSSYTGMRSPVGAAEGCDLFGITLI